MNTQRIVWAALTLLFAVFGLVIGFGLGQLQYQQWARTLVEPMSFAPFTLAVGFGIVMARIGSFFADRTILPGLRRLSELSAADRVLGVIGALLGLSFGVLITLPIQSTALHPAVILLLKFCVMAVFAALGMVFFGGMRAEMLRVLPQLESDIGPVTSGAKPKFLDTNIIIDGRLADICKTGFIEGPLYVPSFVLEEVQHVADSSDGLRRARGRRGLDVLNAMKELTTAQIINGQTVLTPLVHVLSDIPPAVQKIHAVDSKLVALAKVKGGSLITNDFNLNKVAELQGVEVLNLNELSQAIKPVVLPGEEMQVTIVKEGKEAGQGVGYLEDGTMVVVSDGSEKMGETCIVIISTVYQTVAGKMIFSELRDKGDRAPQIKGSGDDLFSENNGGAVNSAQIRGRNDDFGNRSGSGMRRKGRA